MPKTLQKLKPNIMESSLAQLVERRPFQVDGWRFDPSASAHFFFHYIYRFSLINSNNFLYFGDSTAVLKAWYLFFLRLESLLRTWSFVRVSGSCLLVTLFLESFTGMTFWVLSFLLQSIGSSSSNFWGRPWSSHIGQHLREGSEATIWAADQALP